MNIRKKIMLYLCCAAMAACCAFGFAGCGLLPAGTGDNGGSSEDGSKAVITVAMLSSEKKSFERLEKAFEAKYTNVDVRINVYTSYETAMTNFVRNGNWTDIVWTAGDQHAGYSGAGHFLNLKDFAAADDTFDFATSGIYPVLLEATHYSFEDDGYWFMPRDYNIPIIFVNKSHLSRAGINYEELKANWNYETFLQTCNTLKDAYALSQETDDDVRVGFLRSAYPLELDAVKMSNFTGILKSFGGEMFDTSAENISDICAFRKAESVSAYKQFYQTFYESGLVDPSDTNASLFNKKMSGMWLAVRPEVANIPASVDYDFLPSPFEYTGVGCGGYAITKRAAEKEFNGKKISEYCWELLKFIVSEEGQNALSETGLLVPAISQLKDSGVWTEYGNTDTVKRNHTAFTDFSGTVVGLNDAKLFAPAYNIAVDKELVSLVTHCIQYKGGNFESDFNVKANEVFGRIQGYKLA